MTSGIFFQDVRNLYSVLSTSDIFCIHIQLRRVSEQKIGGLSPVLLFQSTKALKHLLVQELDTCATFTVNHCLNLASLACSPVSSHYCIKNFCSVGFYR